MTSLVPKALFVVVFACSCVRVAALNSSGVGNPDEGGTASGSGIASGCGMGSDCGITSGSGVEYLNGSEVDVSSEHSTEETLLNDCDHCTPCLVPGLDLPRVAQFVGLYPCISVDSCSDCDIFMYIAGYYTQQLWLTLDGSLRCHELLTYPLLTENSPVYDSWAIYAFSHPGRLYRPQGFIGPSTTYAGLVSDEVRKHYDIPFLSYTPPSAALDGAENLYSTASSVHFLHKVRLQLLKDHEWYRFAIVSSSEDSFSLDAEQFFLLANSSDVGYDIHFPGSFTGSPDVILKQLQVMDIRIFVAMVGKMDARNLMCRANRLGLTSKDHVWILPGLYDAYWWHSSGEGDGDYNCTNDEILEAINSTLFVDTPNIYPFNITSDGSKTSLNNYSKLLYVQAKSSAFCKEDLNEQYLYHSRALNTIDALTAMERIWNYTYRELCLNKRNLNLTDADLCNAATSVVVPDGPPNVFKQQFKKNLEDGVFCGVSGVYILDPQKAKDYGQGMISQFGGLGAEECLIGVYQNFNYSQEQCSKMYLNISDFELQYMEEFSFKPASAFDIGDTILPLCTNYTWKGRDQAPTDGGCRGEFCKCYSQVGVDAWVSSGVIALGGVIVPVALLVFNFAYRNNKHMKTSSPRLNLFVISGCILIYPVSLLLSIEFSGKQLIKDDDQRMFILPCLCEFRKWMFFLGIILIIGTLFVRNWRLYRIFYNRRIQELRFLSDWTLAVILFFLILPVVLLLTLWSAVDNYKYTQVEHPYPCPDLDVDESVTTFLVRILCISHYSYIWQTLIVTYIMILSLGLLFFSYQNSKVSSHIAQEGEFTTKVMLVSLCLLTPTSITVLLISQLYGSTQHTDPSQLIILYWTNFVFVVLFPSSVLGALFIPKVIFMKRDRMHEKHKLHEVKRKQHTSKNLEHKKDEINRLKSGLKLRETQISTIRTNNYERLRGASMSSVSSSSIGWELFENRTKATVDYSYNSGSTTPPISPALKYTRETRWKNNFDDAFEEEHFKQ